MWTSERIHKELREIAITLNDLCFVEVSILVFFCYLEYYCIKEVFNFVDADKDNIDWLAASLIAPITAGIFGLVGHINKSFNKEK